MVYVEDLFSNRYRERRAEIDRYGEAIEYMRNAVLSPRDSLSPISEIKRLHDSRRPD